MNRMKHILVCQDNEELIRKFSHEAIVVSTTDPDAVGHWGRVIEENNKIHCIELQLNGNLVATDPREDWKGLPLHIVADKMGHFLDFVRIRPLLQPLNLRIFLRTASDEIYTDLQLISSLGIAAGVYFDDADVNWKEFADLQDFAVYPKVPRGFIEPFHYIVVNYEPKESMLFSGVYFNNPTRYLHIDKNENVAMSKKDLKDGKYIFAGIEHLNEVEQMPGYLSWFKDQKKVFMKMNSCSACPGWRICGGFFKDKLESNPGCSEAFTELIDAADIHFNNRSKNIPETELCQL